MTKKPFALWITGLPASGKSTIAAAVARSLGKRGLAPVVLESDRMREILTPGPSYSADERDRFYRQLVSIGETIFRAGVPVIFDATANLRSYRDRARTSMPPFVEVYVDTPLDVCESRDPKGIYAAARSGSAATVPGAQSVYEPPERPELVVDGTAPAEQNAEHIVALLESLGCV